MIYELDLLAEYVCQLNSANHGHYTESASLVLPMLEQLVQIMFTLHTTTYNIHFLNMFC